MEHVPLEVWGTGTPLSPVTNMTLSALPRADGHAGTSAPTMRSGNTFRDCNEPRYALKAFNKERFGKLDLMNEKNVLQKLGCTAMACVTSRDRLPGKTNMEPEPPRGDPETENLEGRDVVTVTAPPHFQRISIHDPSSCTSIMSTGNPLVDFRLGVHAEIWEFYTLHGQNPLRPGQTTFHLTPRAVCMFARQKETEFMQIGSCSTKQDGWRASLASNGKNPGDLQYIGGLLPNFVWDYNRPL